MACMTAEPVSMASDDPLDPMRILGSLPESRRADFLAAYREAADGAREPEGWAYLRRVLRAWAHLAERIRQPGFLEAERAALAGIDTGGMLLEDYLAQRSGR